MTEITGRTNTYRATSPVGVHHFGEDVFEREFTPVEERDWLAGHLELVPRKYRVVSDNYERPKGEVFEAALVVEIEAALLQGRHLERVDRASGGAVKEGDQSIVGDEAAPDQVVPAKPRKKAE